LLFTTAQNQKFNSGAEQNKNSGTRISFITKLILIAELLLCAAPELNF
jgi:hypothetical protein